MPVGHTSDEQRGDILKNLISLWVALNIQYYLVAPPQCVQGGHIFVVAPCIIEYLAATRRELIL